MLSHPTGKGRFSKRMKSDSEDEAAGEGQESKNEGLADKKEAPRMPIRRREGRETIFSTKRRVEKDIADNRIYAGADDADTTAEGLQEAEMKKNAKYQRMNDNIQRPTRVQERSVLGLTESTEALNERNEALVSSVLKTNQAYQPQFLSGPKLNAKRADPVVLAMQVDQMERMRKQ